MWGARRYTKNCHRPCEKFDAPVVFHAQGTYTRHRYTAHGGARPCRGASHPAPNLGDPPLFTGPSWGVLGESAFLELLAYVPMQTIVISEQTHPILIANVDSAQIWATFEFLPMLSTRDPQEGKGDVAIAQLSAVTTSACDPRAKHWGPPGKQGSCSLLCHACQMPPQMSKMMFLSLLPFNLLVEHACAPLNIQNFDVIVAPWHTCGIINDNLASHDGFL